MPDDSTRIVTSSSGSSSSGPTVGPARPAPIAESGTIIIQRDAATPAPPLENTPLFRVGDFRIVRELGRGGMGVVYEAVQESLGRTVALKILPHHATLDPTTLERFRREAGAASRLDHPGLCAVYATGTSNAVPYIAMRYVEGEPLSRRIGAAREAKVEPPMVDLKDAVSDGDTTESLSRAGSGERARLDAIVRFIEAAARAVHAAHEAGVIHRDLKPGNIMVTPEGRPVILDFGLALDLADESRHLTISGDIFGTPAYMAPEQCRGDHRAVDRVTDVYALAVTLFECLTLKRPFEGATRELLIRSILDSAPPDARVLNAAIPGDLKVVLETALDKSTDRRYLTAFDFAEDLRRVRSLEPIRAKPAAWFVKVKRWAQRRPAAAALTAVLAIGVPTVAALGGYLSLKYPQIREAEERRQKDRIRGVVDQGYDALSGIRSAGDRRNDRALAAFRRALALEPMNPEAVVGVALALRRGQRYADLIAHLDEHPLADDGRSVAARLRADALRGLDRRAEAEAAETAAGRPKSGLDHMLSSMFLAEHRRHDGDEIAKRALEDARRALLLAEAPGIQYFYTWARAAAYAADKAAAGEVAEVLTARWPERARAHFYAGFALHLAGEFEGAERAYRRARELDPTDDNVAENFGHLLHISFQRYDEAEALYRDALARRPANPDVMNLLGALLDDLGRNDEAAAAFLKVLELDPDYDMAGANYCHLLLKERKHEEALAWSDTAIERWPKSAAIWNARGVVLSRLDRDADAVKAFEAAVLADPEDIRTRLNLATSYGNCGRIEDGLGACAKAQAIDPAYAEIRLHRAGILGKADRSEEAVDEFRAFLELVPGHVGGWNNLGATLEEIGRWKEALDAYVKARDLSPTAPLVHRNLVEVLEKLEDADAIEAEAERWSKIDPAAAWAYTVAARVHLAADIEEHDPLELEAARRAAERAVAITKGVNPGCLVVLARIQAREGNDALALQTVEEALPRFTRLPEGLDEKALAAMAEDARVFRDLLKSRLAESRPTK